MSDVTNSMPQTLPLLSVQDLRVSYGNIEALKGINFEIHSGEIVSLIGANGAGKTTTLKTISGLLKPTHGKIIFGGEEIGGMKPHRIVRRNLLQAPEGRGIFAHLTVEENLMLGAYTREDSRHEIKKDLEHCLWLFPRLKERFDQVSGTLSGGEQQMLAISRSLMGRPRLLLLDEPSLGLAPQMVEKIFQIIVDINRGDRGHKVTILLVEQNAYQALKISHRAYVIENGHVVLAGSAAELSGNPRVREAYLGG